MSRLARAHAGPTSSQRDSKIQNRRRIPTGVLICLSALSIILTRSYSAVLFLHSQGPCRYAESLGFEAPRAEHQPAKQPTRTHKQTFTTAICAIVKDPEAYLVEWLDYNLIGLEFENIYLYDNSDRFELEGWYNRTRDHPVYSRVEVFHLPGRRRDGRIYVQSYAYNDCILSFGQGIIDGMNWKASPRHDYMALIDTDEFIALKQYPHKHQSIHDLLEEYVEPFGGGLVLNWMLYGTGNRSVYSPMPVTYRFRYRDQLPHPMVKTIVKSADFLGVASPHIMYVNSGKFLRDTAFPGSVKNSTEYWRPLNMNIPSSVAVLNHYRFMSDKEYYDRRCRRGEVDKATNKGCIDGKMSFENTVEHVRPRPGEVYDDSAWKFLVSKVEKYKMFEDPAWEDYT